MVKIRLSRKGKKHQPSFRIVVIDSRAKATGKTLETIGFYDPKTKPVTVKIKNDRLSHWLKLGAQPTETVRKLIEK